MYHRLFSLRRKCSHGGRNIPHTGIAQQQDALVSMAVVMVVMRGRLIFRFVSMASRHHAAISRMAPCPRQLQ